MPDILRISGGLRAGGTPAGSLTAQDIATRFLDDVELRHKGGLVGPALVDRHRHYLGLFAGALGDLAAADCRPTDLTRWILGQEGWKSDHTRQDAARSVLAAFQWALDEDLLEKNPLKKFRPCWNTPQPRGAITPAEYGTLMRLARECNGKGRRKRPSRGAFRVALFFLMETGARTCEMREALWTDVDFDRGVITLGIHKTSRKTGKPRMVPLGARVLRLLRWMHRKRPEGKENVFLSSRKTPWTKDTFARLFRKYADLAGVRKGVTAYCLRHGFTVEGLEAGVGERQLADVLGQSSTRYVAWYGKDCRSKADYLNGVVEQARGRAKKAGG